MQITDIVLIKELLKIAMWLIFCGYIIGNRRFVRPLIFFLMFVTGLNLIVAELHDLLATAQSGHRFVRSWAWVFYNIIVIMTYVAVVEGKKDNIRFFENKIKDDDEENKKLPEV